MVDAIIFQVTEFYEFENINYQNQIIIVLHQVQENYNKKVKKTN